MLHERAADQRCGGIAQGSNDGSPEVRAREARAAGCGIIETRPHAPRIGGHLPQSNERAKRGRISNAQSLIESRGESSSSDGAEDGFPAQRVVVVSAAGTLQFDGNRKAGCNSGRNSEEQAKAETVADSEHDGVRHHPGQQPQGTMRAAQEIVSQIQAAKHIEANAAEANDGDGAVIHPLDRR